MTTAAGRQSSSSWRPKETRPSIMAWEHGIQRCSFPNWRFFFPLRDSGWTQNRSPDLYALRILAKICRGATFFVTPRLVWMLHTDPAIKAPAFRLALFFPFRSQHIKFNKTDWLRIDSLPWREMNNSTWRSFPFCHRYDIHRP